jgi:hypothetical protein
LKGDKEEERQYARDKTNQEVEIHELNMNDAGVRRDISERQQTEAEKAGVHRREQLAHAYSFSDQRKGSNFSGG